MYTFKTTIKDEKTHTKSDDIYYLILILSFKLRILTKR